MNNVRNFFFILFILISSSISAKTSIVFVNGITTTTDGAQKNLHSLWWRYCVTASLDCSNIEFKSFYNPTQGFYKDGIELTIQAQAEKWALDKANQKIALILPKVYNINPSLYIIGTDEYNYFRAYLAFYLSNIYYEQELNNSRIWVDAGILGSNQNIALTDSVKAFQIIAAKVINELSLDDKTRKVVLIPHSQGNYFAQAVSAFIQLKYPDGWKRFSVHGVASVSSVAQFKTEHTTHSQDQALLSHAALNEFDRKPNFDAGWSLGKNAAEDDFLQKHPDDVTNHGFFEVYMGFKALLLPIDGTFCAISFVPTENALDQRESRRLKFGKVCQPKADIQNGAVLIGVGSKFPDLRGSSLASYIISKINFAVQLVVPPVPLSGSFSVFNFTGTSADSSISRIGKLPVAFAPNDAGIGFGMENYTQNNTTKLGSFRISKSNGIFSLLAGPAGAVINERISVVAVNDSGQAIISKMIVDVNAPTVATYSLVGTGGALTPLDIQSTGPVVLLNNGNIAVLANDSHGVKFYDQSSRFLNDINVGTTYYIQGLGKDGLIYGLRSSPSAPPMPGTLNPPVNFGEFIPIVIFNDGLTKDLPCNLTSRSMYMPGSSLTRPVSGIECSNILAASGNGYVAGHFHHSDGRQGVFRYSKLGFEEITINPSYFGKSMFGAGTTLEPPTVRGISNDGTILLAPAYSNSQTCQGGPYFVSGTTITDLKSYIPTNSCFNISTGISGGSRVFMSSQAQGVSLYMVRNP